MDIWHKPRMDVASVNRGQIAPVLLGLWIGISYGVLILLEEYTVELYFTISLIGLLVIGFLFAPPQTSRKWWSRFRWITLLALAVFAFILFQRVMTVLQ